MIWEGRLWSDGLCGEEKVHVPLVTSVGEMDITSVHMLTGTFKVVSVCVWPSSVRLACRNGCISTHAVVIWVIFLLPSCSSPFLRLNSDLVGTCCACRVRTLCQKCE